MRSHKALLWLPALMVLGGCPGPVDPPVPPPPDKVLTSVTVSCEPASFPALRRTQCSALARDQDNNTLQGATFVWRSGNEAVARVSTTGLVKGSTPGSAPITATATLGSATQQGQVAVTVTAVEPTLHSSAITANETWGVDKNPHVVQGAVEIKGTASPTLTLEAGVEVRFEAAAELRVAQGALKALGSQEAPIRMVARQDTPTKGFWRGLVFAKDGSASELAHVTLSHCGGERGTSVPAACIRMERLAAPVLRTVSVENSLTTGVDVEEDSAFGPGSTQLSVSDSGGMALRIGAGRAGTLPLGGSFTNNNPNMIALGGNVLRTQTWPNLGIPYYVSSDIFVDSVPPSTLTIAAGTELRFGERSALVVGGRSLSELVVNGTEAAGVRFTSASSEPKPGDWAGIRLYGVTKASRISHATIEYAGAGVTGSFSLYFYKDEGAGCDNNPVIDHVLIRKSLTEGAYVTGGFGPGSTHLTVRDAGSSPVAIDAECVNTLPTELDLSGNPTEVVGVHGNVATTQTWRKLDYPYLVGGLVSVGSDANPVLTLQPGTDVLFTPNGSFRIGAQIERVEKPGNLIAEGTAAAPIRFIPHSASPARGHWKGLHFWMTDKSKLNHVIVSHAGRASAASSGDFGTGNLNVYREAGEFVTHSTFRDSSGCGVVRNTGNSTGTTVVTTDFTKPSANNTLVDNTGGAQCGVGGP